MENKKEDAVDEDVGNEHDDEHDEECSDEETHSDAPQHSTKQPTTTTKQPNRKPPLVQVFVFSATLTLPAVLRKRLKGGQGGASGSSSLQTLMDTIPFRPKPTIVDLTAERKLGDKVGVLFAGGWVGMVGVHVCMRACVCMCSCVYACIYGGMHVWGASVVSAVPCTKQKKRSQMDCKQQPHMGCER